MVLELKRHHHADCTRLFARLFGVAFKGRVNTELRDLAKLFVGATGSILAGVRVVLLFGRRLWCSFGRLQQQRRWEAWQPCHDCQVSHAEGCAFPSCAGRSPILLSASLNSSKTHAKSPQGPGGRPRMHSGGPRLSGEQL